MSLVTSKTRVAAIKSQTILHLELLGALLLVRIISSVYNALQSEIHQGAIQIHKLLYTGLERKEWKPFVYNRVRIRELVPNENLEHCVGRSNPVDIPFCGSSVGVLIHSHLWWNGPEDDSDQELIGEMPRECKGSYELLNRVSVDCCLVIIDIHSYGQPVAVTAYVLRFIEGMRIRWCERLSSWQF